MSAGKKFYAKQIDKALASAKEINQEEHPRIVVFSDCHRGNGTWNDSFLNNKTLFQAALGYYRENDFTYIELGDGDELWENRKFSDIEEIHADIFQQFLFIHLLLCIQRLRLLLPGASLLLSALPLLRPRNLRYRHRSVRFLQTAWQVLPHRSHPLYSQHQVQD